MNQSQLYTLYDRDPAPIVSFLEYLRDLYDLPRGGMVLDMGCGPGRLLRPLDDVDWIVTGYEPDPDYAPAAREAIRQCRSGEFRQAGFLDLNPAPMFDLIAAINGPYCYLLRPRDRREALRRCAAALHPGGVLFLELSNFFWILKNYRDPPALETDVNGIRVRRAAEHKINYHYGTFTHHDRFTWLDESGAQQVVTKTHRMAMVSFSEIAFFLNEVGFRDVHTFNSFDDRQPGNLVGRRMLISARRR